MRALNWMFEIDWVQGFVPNLVQAAGLLAVLAAGLVMVVLGRAVLGQRTLPEIAMIAGWGLISLVLTLWGVVTPEDMRFPAVALIAVAVVAAILPRGRLHRDDMVALGRLLALAATLLAVFVAAYPSQPDTFTNQLPNAAYLYDYGQFPASNRPPMLAVWPAFPYNLQLATFLPALLAPDFPPSILTHVNLLLDLAFALLLARWMRPAGTPISVPPPWSAIAAGLLLTVFLNPGFDPKILFSGYGDPAIAVAVAFAAWQAMHLLDVVADGQSPGQDRLTLTFVLLAGVAIKQVSVFLMASIVGVAFLIGAFDRRIGPMRALTALAPAFIPALLLRGVWEFYARTHFPPDAELQFLPFAEWNTAIIPAIFLNMALQIWERMPFFLVLYGVALAAIPLAIRRGYGPLSRLFLLTLGVTLLYTGFLVFTYVAHFSGEIGASAHSFFRYNMHLGLLGILAVVGLARELWLDRGAPQLGRFWPTVEIGAIVWAILTPILLAGWIRYDLREPQPLVWDLARFVAPHLHDGEHIALLLPGDNGGVAPSLKVAITMTPPRRALAVFHDFARADKSALDEAKRNGDSFALISCVTPELDGAFEADPAIQTAGKAALLANDHGIWRLVGSHAYPAELPPFKFWSAQLAAAPFCK